MSLDADLYYAIVSGEPTRVADQLYNLPDRRPRDPDDLPQPEPEPDPDKDVFDPYDPDTPAFLRRQAD